eukprot:7534216-Ditylum_brightwellii.AAC.1
MHLRERRIKPLFLNQYGRGEDPNYWLYSDDPPYEDQDDWQEMMARQKGETDTGHSVMSMEDNNDSDDDMEAWLDVLSSITAD